MVVFTHPLALLLALPAVALTLAIWHRGFVVAQGTQSQGRALAALGLRLVLIASIVFGLAGFSLRLPQSRQAVVFVADLSASDAGMHGDIRALINAAMQRRPGQDLAGVVTVGREALVERPVTAQGSFQGFQSHVDAGYTNLQGGLELAGALLPDGYRHRVVALSDGRQNVGDALTTAALLRSRGARVDVVPITVSQGADVLVDGVTVPAQLRPQESFALDVALRSSVDTAAQLSIQRDNRVIMTRQEHLHPGDNSFVFRQAALRAGFHTYTVHVSAAQDSNRKNDTGSAFTVVQGPQRVLVIAADRTKAANVLGSLQSTGIPTDFQAPWQVVPTLRYLERYAAVVLVDTPANALGQDLMRQLVPYVRNLGRGLVVTGGDQSFGLGGYAQTPLEDVLPVKMQIPKRKEVPAVAVVLLIESLETESNIDISKQAGKGVVDLLSPQDQVAVNDTPDDGTSGWVAKLQYVTNKQAIEYAIDQMSPGDPDSYNPYLNDAYKVLLHAPARVKHIILVGDGDISPDSSDKKTVDRIRNAGITLTTVATNDMFGFQVPKYMQKLSVWGGGRYYRAVSASRIPKIFLREARTIGRSDVVSGRFYPREMSANPMVRGLSAVPPLDGYVATKPKPAGEVILESDRHDPVLAGWQYGLGRAVAWTSDAAGRWTRNWLQAPGASRFWVNLVTWTLPAGNVGRLFVATTSAQGQGTISVDTPDSLGPAPEVTARIVDPHLHVSTVRLEPYAPSRYRGSFQTGGQGAYLITAEARGAGHVETGQGGLAVSYPAEYRNTGTDSAFLHGLAAAGGGSVVMQPAAAWANNLPSVSDQRSLSSLLWLLALLLLPVDIAVRRLTLSRRDLLAAFPFLNRPSDRSGP